MTNDRFDIVQDRDNCHWNLGIIRADIIYTEGINDWRPLPASTALYDSPLLLRLTIVLCQLFIPYHISLRQSRTVECFRLKWHRSMSIHICPHWLPRLPVSLKLKHFCDKLLSFNLIRRTITNRSLFYFIPYFLLCSLLSLLEPGQSKEFRTLQMRCHNITYIEHRSSSGALKNCLTK